VETDSGDLSKQSEAGQGDAQGAAETQAAAVAPAEEVGSDFGGQLGKPIAPGTKMIRCGGCHEVIEEAELVEGNCPKCGCPYKPPKSVEAPGGSFVDRFQGTEFAVPPLETPVQAAPRSGPPVLLLVGAGLLVVAFLGGGLLLLGALGKPIPTPKPTPNTVISRNTPTPTLPQAIYVTLDYLQDPKLSAHVEIDSSVEAKPRIASHPGIRRSHLVADMSAGDEHGTVTVGSLTYEFYVTQGSISYRLMPAGKWTGGGTLSYVVLAPLLDVREPTDLRLGEQTEKNGVPVYHLTSTSSWHPDVMKLAVMGLSSIDAFGIFGGRMTPNKYTLDLYVAMDGAPVYAEYHAWVEASDGERVLAIDTYYTFTNVGEVGPIPTPSGL
jgi:hypothetical protein